MTLIQKGWSFDELIDFTAIRLASLHTVVNPWLYPLTRRKYRDAFWYLLTLFGYYITCTLVARPGTTLGECQPRFLALSPVPPSSLRESLEREPGIEVVRESTWHARRFNLSCKPVFYSNCPLSRAWLVFIINKST